MCSVLLCAVMEAHTERILERDADAGIFVVPICSDLFCSALPCAVHEAPTEQLQEQQTHAGIARFSVI